MGQFIQPIYGLRKDKALAATLAAPTTDSDGVSVVNWRPSPAGAGYPAAAIAIFGDANITLASAVLYAYGPYGIDGAYVWMYVAALNNGTDITLTATRGYVQNIQLPTAFTRLCVGGTPSGNNVSYTATPIALHG